MSSASTQRSAPLNHAPAALEAKGGPTLLSPWICGPLLTAGFYGLISQLPTGSASFARYFSDSWIAYIETGAFFVGVAVLLRKTLGLVHDRRALKQILIDADSLDGIDAPAERAAALLTATAGVPHAMRRSKVVGRIEEVCEYVASRETDAGLEDHLRYLADLGVEASTGSFAVVRTITWCIPVLGALGLVLGLAQAFRAVDPQDLDSSMPLAIAGIATAFEPLAAALLLAMALLFARFLVERGESHVLAEVEHFGISQLALCFNCGQEPRDTSPLAEAQTQAAEHLIDRTEALVSRQTAAWQEALEGLRGRWVETLQSQEAKLAASLGEGMSATLANHSQQLEEARGEFLKGFRAVGLELSRVTAGLQQMGEEHQALFLKQVTDVWQALRTEMSADRDQRQTQIERSIAAFEQAARDWHADLTATTAALTAQLAELRENRETLDGIAGQEEELLRLQNTLTHNLQSVRAVEAFEESIHSLNAAVHMLTIRAKAHAA
jgi:MotA/TolQ/ExbB proton channel family